LCKLFIYYENHPKYSDKKEKTRQQWSMLNAHCARRKATLYFTPAIAAKAESLVTDMVMHFPIIA